ncbi:hypothetical protein NHX12_014836 [Muraenolepis orangiensis]|uniref:Inhibin alpha chain n=1 Tax=Muraenolepis orangiensis TaxID=630683 RepID=A0A9Q0DAV3_9TELE|nr:hypothetical protein NHX12_014836 [Muraenolepis orangiensis]
MLSLPVWALLVLVGAADVARACPDLGLPREVALALFKDRMLGRMGLEAAPLAAPPEFIPRRPRSASRAGGSEDRHKQDSSQIIVFPSSDSPCGGAEGCDGTTANGCFSYRFRWSNSAQDLMVTSAHLWFHAGPASNSSAPLYLWTSERHAVRLAEGPSVTASDGWTTYNLGDQKRCSTLPSGPFMLQVRCTDCLCRNDDAEKTPFLHLRVGPRVPGRAPRGAPWSPLAVDILRRPPPQQPEHADCWRDKVDVSFDELGWGNWIVHPKAVTFGYCRGNCSAPGFTAASLGIKQCCAPVPESMKSLRITTTSDGGYSFKYETLPNIIPEECACV